ncbi:MAG: lysylphosphatidylglycerol synthase transmembrane domain-containing protein [Thermomicrobiales bacterium]
MRRLLGNPTALAFWAGLLIAIVVLWATGVMADAWQGLRDARPLPLVLVVIVGMALPLVHAWRWQVVMRSLDVPLSIGEVSDITVSSALLNYASPGFVGASAKAVLANQTRSVPYHASALSIGFEHSLDLGLMAITSALAILIIGPSAFRDAIPSLSGTAAFLLVAALVAVLFVGIFVARRFRLMRHIEQLIESARQLGRRVNRSEVGGLTFLYWVLQVIVVGLLFWALGINIVIVDVLAIATVPVLAGMLAPVPGGVGVREAVIVALTAVTGATTATLLTLAIVQRVLLVSALPLSLALVRVARRIDERFA